MPWWAWVLIIFVAIVGCAYLIYVIQNRKEDKEDKVELSKQNLNDLVSSIEVLLSLCDDEKLKTEIENVQDKIRYSSPSSDPKVLEYDGRIADRLGDLKLALARAKDSGSYHSSSKLTSEIDLLLIERNALIKK